MDSIKINASFILPGRVLPAEQSCSKNDKKKKEKKKKEKNDILYTQESVKIKNQKIVINLRVPKPVRQNMHLNIDAYNYMISSENPARGLKSYEWKKLTKNKRIQLHLQEIADNLRGTLESFSVMED